MDTTTKLTAELADQLRRQEKSGVVDLVIELRPPDSHLAASGFRSRPDKIAALKQAFERAALPVEDAIHRAGGNVTSRAWINQTVRALVPADSVAQLAERDDVVGLDIPRALDADVR